MSWSVAAQGKVADVRKEIAGQFARSGPCVQPEEKVRLEAAKFIDLSLEANVQDSEVKVSAYGSQSGYDDKARNSLNITITPQG